MRETRRSWWPPAVVLCLAWVLMVSCQSVVGVRHLTPAQVDLSKWRNVAVLPCGGGLTWKSHRDIYFEDIDHYLHSGADDETGSVRAYADELLLDSLSSTGYFHLVSRDEADATIQMHIDYLAMDEVPKSRDILGEKLVESNGVKKRVKTVVGAEYSLEQRVQMKVSWYVREKESGAVLSSDSYADVRRNSFTVAKRVYGNGEYDDTLTWLSPKAPSMEGMARSLIESFEEKMVRTISPTWRTERVSLLPAKPKSESFKTASKLASQGKSEDAYAQFLGLWEDEGHVYAGMNAALLLASQGKLEEALELAGQVASQSDDRKVQERKRTLARVAESQREAKRQFGTL